MCSSDLLLGPYTPMLFMGEEWAASTPWQFFASFPDPELAEAVRTGRRREFSRHGWGESEIPDPMDPATVERSTLQWDEVAEPNHASMLETYRGLIALRRGHAELADPSLRRLEVESADDGSWIVMHRGELRVVCNFGTEPVTFTGLDGAEVLLSSVPPVGGGSLAGESFAVLRV